MSDEAGHSVHTSAQEPDLFPPVPPDAPGCTLSFTGRLVHRPYLALKSDKPGHFRPMLVVELDHVGPANQSVVAHVPYTEQTRDQGEQLARSMNRGDLVTVSCPLADMRVFLAAASLSPTTSQ